MVTRRTFLKVAGATSAALTLGPDRWGWALSNSPFGELKDDPILKLPEGFNYRIIAETGDLLEGGRGPASRPHFPDLNVVFAERNGKLLLSTSHEIPAEFPVAQPPPDEDYDQAATGAITSLLLNPDLSIAESAYNVGGMINNCSGGRTPWGTVLTGEESTSTLEAEHGFIWEVDVDKHTKTRLDACGKFDHEAAVVHQKTGFVYLTEDSGGDSLLYRMRPKERRHLEKGGVLEAYKAGGKWVRIGDPLGKNGEEPSAQGVAKGALKFARLEGTKIRHPWLYFTETEDDTACGKVWRLNLDTFKLELWAEGRADGKLCMPDNFAFDARKNMFVCEDRGAASTDNPNHIVLIDRDTGKMSIFAEVVQENQTPGVNIADEPTGIHFSPDCRTLFLNLQRANGTGLTVAIRGPFAKRDRSSLVTENVTPPGARPEETRFLTHNGIAFPGMTTAALAAAIRLRRLGRIESVSPEIEQLAAGFGVPEPIDAPKRRGNKFDLA